MTYFFLLIFRLLSFDIPDAGVAKNYQKETQTTFSRTIDSLRNRKVIYRSSDNGRTWTPFDNGIPNQATVNGFTSKGNKIFIVTNVNGVFVSENGVNNWKAIKVCQTT